MKAPILETIKAFLFLSLISPFLNCRAPDYEPEKFYLPDNYIGWIFVIHSQPGAEMKFDDGVRIYTIPTSGIYFTGFNTNFGWIDSVGDRQFFYVKNDKVLKEIPCYYMPDSLFNIIFYDSLVAFPLPPHGKGQYSVYPVYIDTLKNISKYDHERIPIEEYQIDSMIKLK